MGWAVIGVGILLVVGVAAMLWIQVATQVARAVGA